MGTIINRRRVCGGGGKAEKMILATLTLTDDSVVVINGEGTLTADMVADYVSTCKYFVAGNNCTSIGSGVLYNCKTLKSVVLSDSVLNVGNYAFRNCTNVTNIDLGHGVTSLGYTAFYDTVPIELHIPASLITIGASFSPRRAVTITVEEGNTVYDSRENCNCLMVTSTDTLLLGCVNSFIPNTCKDMGDRAFINTAITSITIPDGVLGINGFGESSLSSITIPNSVTRIGSGAFCRCKSLTSIVIPNTCKDIRNRAFIDSALTEITIGHGVTSIGSYAFYNCSQLAQVTILAVTPPTLGDYVFEGNKAGRKIYVPAESVEAYKTAAGWSTYADDIEAIPT